jgi:hypothetical protein
MTRFNFTAWQTGQLLANLSSQGRREGCALAMIRQFCRGFPDNQVEQFQAQIEYRHVPPNLLDAETA